MTDMRVCCGEMSSVIDGRANRAGFRRRRVCKICERRWTTLEVELTSDIHENSKFKIGDDIHENLLDLTEEEWRALDALVEVIRRKSYERTQDEAILSNLPEGVLPFAAASSDE